MTSDANDSEITTYFMENKFFGLDPKSVHFFCQVELTNSHLLI